MNYRVIGLMSGSSLDGLDIVYVLLEETAGRWTFEIKHSACIPYTSGWVDRLSAATCLSAREYLLLDTDYGHLVGGFVREFISRHELAYQVQFVASHGHTVFHMPERKMTAQLGDGAAICSELTVPVISNLRSMDVARGGQGAPVVPIGEKYLFPATKMFLNLGGIANISCAEPVRAGFDVCPANRVLNELSKDLPGGFDKDGDVAATGRVNESLLSALNQLDYYGQAYPKSLANDFGLTTVLPLILGSGLNQADSLRTYVEHIVFQISASASQLSARLSAATGDSDTAIGTAVSMLITGGGAHNSFLVSRLRESLAGAGIGVEIPGDAIIDYKEALIMALMGTLRWRDEVNVLASVTGASADSINGAVYVP